jgi:hypothetical protein
MLELIRIILSRKKLFSNPLFFPQNKKEEIAKYIITMKNIFFGLIATVFFGYFGNAQRYTSKDFNNIGLEHNDILNYAFNQIKVKKANNNKELNLLLQTYIKNTNGYSSAELLQSQKNVNNAFTNPINVDKNLYTNEYSANINSNVKIYLDRLYILLETNSYDVFNKSIYNFELEIEEDQNLKNNDLLILFSATNVAKSSFDYWNTNTVNWHSLNNNIASEKGAGGRIVKADVAGAVAGACAAWAANLVPGAGQVAYGSSIAVWAAGCSGYQATMEILDSWF